jgi:hypothetical protein
MVGNKINGSVKASKLKSFKKPNVATKIANNKIEAMSKAFNTFLFIVVSLPNDLILSYYV